MICFKTLTSIEARGNARLRAQFGLRSGVVVLSLLTSLAPAVESSDPATTGVSAQAYALVQQAQVAREKGAFAEARTLLIQAQGLTPDNPAIGRELALLTAADTGSGAATSAAPMTISEWAAAEIRLARNRAEIMARAGRPEDAAEQLEVVRHALLVRHLEQDPDVASLLTILDADLVRLRHEQAELNASKAQREREAALNDAGKRVADASLHGSSQRAERLRRVRDLQAREHYEVALSEIRTLIDDFPEDEEIRDVYRSLLSAAHKQRKLDYDQQLSELRQELNERLGRNLLPTGIDGMPIYPRDFAARHTDSAAIVASQEPEWKSAIRDTLRNRVSLIADGQSGFEVLTALAAASHLNLVIDPSLAAAGDRPIDHLHAPSLSLENALTWVCTLMDTRWSLNKGAVWIGADTDSSDSTLAIYDLSLLITGALDQPGKHIGYDQGAGKAGGATFVDAASKPPTQTPEELADLIKLSITPTIWTKDPNGITVRGNQLFVNAPADTHRLLNEFIHAQEQAKNLLVKVDTRWLTLRDDFVEEIGVDWTIANSMISIPGLSAGYTKQGSSWNATGNATHPLPASASNYARTGSTQGLSLNFTLIGPLQLSAILTATERNARGRILNAPSVTTVNGVQANVFTGTEIAFVSDYEVVSRHLDPVVSILNVGSALDVKPLVSADHKYVTLDLRPALTSVVLTRDFVTGIRERVNINDPIDDEDPLDPIVDPVPVGQYPIDLPNLTVREAATTLTIPDRGSALIGGFSRDLEQTAETRIPFLGNLPYLGRLFGRRGRYSEHEKLYLLATISIITYDEQEAKL